jgi:uncharacterized protein YkwD
MAQGHGDRHCAGEEELVAAKFSALLATALAVLLLGATSAAAIGLDGGQVAAGAAAKSSTAGAGQLVAPLAACPGQESLAAPIEAQERAMACMVDFARRQAGLAGLTGVAALQQSAADKAADILSCDSFSHFACGRKFSYWMEQTGYTSAPCWHVGENLAWGSGEYGSVRSIFIAWLRSPRHRENLLGDYAETGISLQVGALGGQPGTRVWAEHFGSRCD